MKTRITALVASVLALSLLHSVGPARATAETCEITLRQNDGGDLDWIWIYPLSEIYLYLPMDREGFQFVGWNTEESGDGDMFDTEVAFDPSGTGLCSGSDLTRIDVLFAQWVTVESLYRTWNQTLIPTTSPRVGETIYASAFERYLDDALVTDESEVDEYVYRISTEANNPARSVDLQPQTGYTPLTAPEQDAWYEVLGEKEAALLCSYSYDDVSAAYADCVANYEYEYEFSWYAFLCFNPEADVPTFSNPDSLRTSYVSMEDGLESVGGIPAFGRSHRYLLHRLSLEGRGPFNARTTVGEYDPEGRFLMGGWAVVVGSLDVGGNCGELTLGVFPLVDADDVRVNSKSYEIAESIEFEAVISGFSGTVSIPSDGVHLGVTGRAPSFNAALWGLTKVGIAAPSITPSSVSNGPSTPVAAAPASVASTSPKVKNRTLISGFAKNSDVLTSRIESRVRRFVKGLAGKGPISCVGSTSGTTVNKVSRELAMSRAQQICALVRRLRPDLLSEVQVKPSQGVGPRYRSVTVEFETS